MTGTRAGGRRAADTVATQPAPDAPHPDAPLDERDRVDRVAEELADAFAQTSAGAFGEAFARRLVRVARDYARQGQRLEEAWSPEELADWAARRIPRPGPWGRLVGPVYGTEQVAALLGRARGDGRAAARPGGSRRVSRQAVADRWDRRSLLALRTADGVLVYPAFQFDEDGRVLPGLAAVLRAFDADPGSAEAWAVASWLRTPKAALGGRPVDAWLRDGGAVEPALVLAHDQARRFAR